ncbi:hypothetical protein ACFO5R_09185 [Halosolutus amylolyticus]|uniref:Uncharacterized protein n=1 Tax=Halosolutus amylolyticus TaxID=2932267 RepID=A0ABD5PNB9_9EURY|nr:hypothetical protein [Halosolutus amylolyticus]
MCAGCWRTIGLCLCLVLAGCAGFAPSDADDPGNETGSIAGDPTAPYDALPDGETVVERHRDRLRSAGSVTIDVESQFRVIGPDDERIERTNRTAELDYTTSPPRRLVVDGDGTERWLGPERNLTKRSFGGYSRTTGSIDLVDGLDPDTIDFLAFDGPTEIDRDGGPHYRYRATGIDPAFEGAFEDDSETVENASATLVLRSDGTVVSATESFVFVDGDTRVEQSRSVRYANVGETDVTRPDWYEEALAETDPLPHETVTETLEIPESNATLAVTGEAGDVASDYGPHPTFDPAGTFSADELAAAQVSCLVQVYLPESYDRAELTLEYADEHVPGGDEDGLALTHYDARSGSFTTIGDVDPATNTATASIDRDGYYFVVHEPTYETAFVSGDEPSETAPPPTCG